MMLSVFEQIVSRYSSYKLWMTSACVRMYPAPDVSVSHTTNMTLSVPIIIIIIILSVVESIPGSVAAAEGCGEGGEALVAV